MTPSRPIKCFLLDHGYTNQTSGPCCQIDDFKTLVLSQGEKRVHSFETLHQNDLWIEIKSSMDAGQWHPACFKCSDAEANGLESMRLNHDEWWHMPIQHKGLMNLTIWTGRECNLQCRSCHPYLSTSWEREFEHMPGTLQTMSFSDHEVKHHLKSCMYSGDDFSSVKAVVLTGGEPLYNKQYFPLLHDIADQTNGQCVLTIITNCTIAWDLEKFPFLKKYKQIGLVCSIDAIGSALEFIRTGSSWDRVQTNLKGYKQHNVHLQYHLTHSALNLFEVSKTRRWLAQAGINDCGLQTFVVQPSYLSYAVFTPKEKEHFARWFDQQQFDSQDKYVLDTLMAADFNPDLRERFFALMDHTKAFHGLDWQHHLPELYQLMRS